ncbi:MAG: hypothetical protein JSW06_00215 [Thermoplasmatales archaeon]|nr:MAG: hypothetical protein JSW06_00215 [Thermoplasmatales archaeon]
MIYKYRKGLVVGVVCFLMLVTVPMVSGEWIRYPKEEGPYTVLIMGNCSGMSGGQSTIFRLIPVWFLFYPRHIGYDFDNDSVFFVNGEKQDILYPAQIDLSGFKGYGPTIYMGILKYEFAAFIGFLTGFMPSPRARVVGLCAELLVIDSR